MSKEQIHKWHDDVLTQLTSLNLHRPSHFHVWDALSLISINVDACWMECVVDNHIQNLRELTIRLAQIAAVARRIYCDLNLDAVSTETH